MPVSAALFLDLNLAEIFQSPFSVPIFGTLMILGIVVTRIWSGVRIREMQSQERLAAIAKGIPLPGTWDGAPQRPTPGIPPAMDTFSPTSRSTKARQGGIVLVCIGFAMIGFFVFLSGILRVREVLIPAAAGLFPLAIGVGLLIDARVRSAEIARSYGWTAATQPPPTTAPNAAASSTASSAAHTDWNPPPLH